MDHSTGALFVSLMLGDGISKHLQVGFHLNLLPLILLLIWLQVAVQLEASRDFLAAPEEKEQRSHCICMNQRHTVSWAVIPKSLGEQQSPEAQESQPDLNKQCFFSRK